MSKKDKNKNPDEKTGISPLTDLERQEPVLLVDDQEPSGFTQALKFNQPNPELTNEIESLKEKVETIGNQSNVDNNEANILKKYISLKEKESLDFKDQQKQYQNSIKKISEELHKYKTQSKEFFDALENARRHEEALKKDLNQMKSKYEGELQLIKNDYEEKLKASGNYQSEYHDLLKKKEEWKEKIKEDLKKIKLKEKELENKYELLKRDTQALLDSKDNHLLELKKKNDAFELELESLEEKLRNAHLLISQVSTKKIRLIETLKLAITLIDGLDNETPISLDEKRKAG